jgi:hypothetical protein
VWRFRAALKASIHCPSRQKPQVREVEMDFETFLTKDGMRSVTQAYYERFIKASAELGQFADAISARLKNQQVKGDRFKSGSRSARTWKATRNLRAAERYLRKAAAAMEDQHGDFVHHVLELAERRELAELQRQQKRDRPSIPPGQVAQSLEASIRHFGSVQQGASPQVGGYYLPPSPAPQAYPRAVGAEDLDFGPEDFFGQAGSQ